MEATKKQMENMCKEKDQEISDLKVCHLRFHSYVVISQLINSESTATPFIKPIILRTF